ncbi:hypothetical protein [Sulfitobacter sp. HGT1]|uniref:COG3904 family protein n=1 Tax=Sulfitobacter sp. HGT1 TaxID=2735435 RepID=UPI0015930C97|nr:hypothetical protein [Sulfitobacter sp. HGT1]
MRLLLFVITFAASLLPSVSLAADQNGEMDFKQVTTGGNCLTCSFIRADGKITADTPEHFRKFVDQSGYSNFNGVDIHLNSPGGNLIAGVQLGVIFRTLGVSTVVSQSKIKEKYKDNHWHLLDPEFDGSGAMCASACSFSFVGGVERYATQNVRPERVGFQKIGRVGVHQFYNPVALMKPDEKVYSANDKKDDQETISRLLSYLKEMGISAEMLQLASITNPKDMHWMTADELRVTNVDNASFAMTFIEAYKNGVAIIEFKYQRMDAAVRNEIWCRDGKLQMLATLSWKGGAVLAPGTEWRLYENMRLGKDGPHVQLTKHTSNWEGDIEVIQMTFSIKGAEARNLVNLRHFDFWDYNSRYATRAAEQLSFSLPDGFDGMHILPRTCQ